MIVNIDHHINVFLLLNRQMSILFCFIKLIESNHSFNKQQDESNKLLLGVIDSLSPPELLSQLLPSSNGNKYDENTIKSNINSEFEYQRLESLSASYGRNLYWQTLEMLALPYHKHDVIS